MLFVHEECVCTHFSFECVCAAARTFLVSVCACCELLRMSVLIHIESYRAHSKLTKNAKCQSGDLVVCVGVDTEAQRKSLRVEPTTGQAQSCIKASYAEDSLARKIKIRGA